jgi:hypothetical protein
LGSFQIRFCAEFALRIVGHGRASPQYGSAQPLLLSDYVVT